MQTPSQQTLKNILFLDIETISCAPSYAALDDALKPLWDKKAASLRNDDHEATSDLFFERAAIYPEFGKVIVVGLGIFSFDAPDTLTLRVKALKGHDEGALLRELKAYLGDRSQPESLRLCAHNGKAFDFPYLCRRMLVNGISPPCALSMEGKKPWEVTHLDTMDLWRFGDRKSFPSLHLLATLFNIRSSKELMDGSEVNHSYYIQDDLDKIAYYCLHDVVVTAQLFLKMHCLQPVQPAHIVFT